MLEHLASAGILGGILARSLTVSQYLFCKGMYGNCLLEAQWSWQSLQASVIFSLLCLPNFVHTHGLALAAKFVFHFPGAFHRLHFSYGPLLNIFKLTADEREVCF